MVQPVAQPVLGSEFLRGSKYWILWKTQTEFFWGFTDSTGGPGRISKHWLIFKISHRSERPKVGNDLKYNVILWIAYMFINCTNQKMIVYYVCSYLQNTLNPAIFVNKLTIYWWPSYE